MKMPYKYFEQTEDIAEALERKDEKALVAILVGIINRDPTFATSRYEETYDYMKRLLGKELKAAKKPLQGEFTRDQQQWDKDYYRMLLVWLSDNFCEERLQLVKKVGNEVYKNEYTFGKDEASNFSVPATETVQKKTGMDVVGISIAVLVVVLVIVLVYIKM